MLRLHAYWSNMFIVLSRVLCNQVRRRIAVVSNDNSNGKTSRFKGLAIVRVPFLPVSRVCHIVYSPFLSSIRRFSSQVYVVLYSSPVLTPHRSSAPIQISVSAKHPHHVSAQYYSASLLVSRVLRCHSTHSLRSTCARFKKFKI